MDVDLIRWPAEAARRGELQRQARPRLLLIEDGLPPAPLDEMEDWIRLPARDCDIQVRVEGVRRRAQSRRPLTPALDDDGVLRHGEQWVPIPPVEARLVGVLLHRFGYVVSREHLAVAGWPDGSPGRNALDVHMLRLRRRVAGVSLAIRTVRSRGYLLERVAEPRPPSAT